MLGDCGGSGHRAGRLDRGDFGANGQASHHTCWTGWDSRMWSALRKLFRRGPASSVRVDRPETVSGRDLLEQLENVFQGSDDVRFRKVLLGDEGIEAAFVFIDGLVDDLRIERSLLWPL